MSAIDSDRIRKHKKKRRWVQEQTLLVPSTSHVGVVAIPTGWDDLTPTSLRNAAGLKG